MKYRFLSLGSLFALVSIMLGTLANLAAPAALYAADTTKNVAQGKDAISSATGKVLSEAKGETKPGLYIVQLADEPLATYKGGAARLAPTSPKATGQNKVNVDAPASRAYRTYLTQRRAAVVSKVEKVVGAKVALTYVYDVAFNGFAVTLTPAQAAQVAALPEVLRVQRDFERELTTDVGPQWIGASQIWDGSATEMYVATILGANEVPATNSTAKGTAELTYDDATSTLSYTVQLTGITPSDAHIHRGAAGANGAVVVALTSTGPSSYAGSTVLTAADEALLRSGGLYLNFHTGTFPGGEIRGQVTGLKGEGMVVGIIDTGINHDHPSFAATGADGYTHVNPRSGYIGYCNPSNPNYSPTANLCNSKLIGVWGFPGTGNTPEDEDGHGSHTASTAAGNVVENAVVNGFTVNRISGVAPHANIIAYNACCALSALLAAINQATADQVDVVNYSIGSSASVDPWDDSDTIAFLAAREGGVFVANSAGNNGPGSNTVGSPGDAPWMLTTGATTHNREYVNALIDMTGGATTPPANLFGKGMNGGTGGPRPIVDASKAPYNNPFCDAFPANTFTNQIVVCNRGGFDQNGDPIGRVQKGQNVLNAGGDGMVLVNDLPNGVVLNGDSHVLPAVMISFVQGQTLRAWLNSGSGHTGTIRGAERVVDNAFGDRMAGFSSRGRNRAVPNILKPDVTAPGVDIIAAYHTDGVTAAPEFNAISGTSMASPHAAGAAALVRQLHPDWTPAEVQSAMTLTGLRTVKKQDGVTPADPFDRGGGRLDVPAAANAGLLLDTTIDEYEAANPSVGGDPSELNLATLANNQCLVTCSWERTFTSALDVPSTWTASVATTTTLGVTVTPNSFTIPAGGSQTVVFTVASSNAPFSAWAFGDITFSEANDLAPDASLPFAVTPVSGIFPSLIETVAHRNIGAETTEEFTTVAASNLTFREYGLVPASELTQQVDEDSDNGSVYDDFTDGTVVKTVTVPAGAVRLVAEIYESEPADVDLYVLRDANNDGIPTEDEEVCVSATAAVDEYCDISDPTPGSYIIIAQNWQGTDDQPDSITLATGVVPGAAS
ncbi:MAG TPA: S8 family serine peptidase, partial [Herpetosiphonaceae bacterium]|nr:S8 family serine peptidase [Herpetosiphonaceae bacterium]